MNDGTQDEFLERVNNVPKKLGHNKMQIQIQDLEREIQKYIKIDGEKEMRLDLYRKNISNLIHEKKVLEEQLAKAKEQRAKDAEACENASLIRAENEKLVDDTKILHSIIAEGKVREEALQVDLDAIGKKHSSALLRLAECEQQTKVVRDLYETCAQDLCKARSDVLQTRSTMDAKSESLLASEEEVKALKKALSVALQNTKRLEESIIERDVQVDHNAKDNPKDNPKTTEQDTAPVLRGIARSANPRTRKRR